MDKKQGGRLYSPLQQTKKEDRKNFLINGNITTELDFKCLHPTLLYAIQGVELKEDAYKIEGYGDEYREIIKRTLNIILNTTKARAYPILYAIYREHELVKGKKGFFKDLVKAIMEKHKVIKEYFFSNQSLMLQYTDSEIALNVIAQCNDLNIPVISIHDSFIVESKEESQVKEFMIKAFQKVMECKFSPKITTK